MKKSTVSLGLSTKVSKQSIHANYAHLQKAHTDQKFRMLIYPNPMNFGVHMFDEKYFKSGNDYEWYFGRINLLEKERWITSKTLSDQLKKTAQQSQV